MPNLHVVSHHAAEPDRDILADPVGGEGDVVADAANRLAYARRVGCVHLRRQMLRRALWRDGNIVVAAQIQSNGSGHQNVGL